MPFRLEIGSAVAWIPITFLAPSQEIWPHPLPTLPFSALVRVPPFQCKAGNRAWMKLKVISQWPETLHQPGPLVVPGFLLATLWDHHEYREGFCLLYLRIEVKLPSVISGWILSPHLLRRTKYIHEVIHFHHLPTSILLNISEYLYNVLE